MGGNKIDVQKQKMLSAKDLKKAIKDAEKGEPDEVFDGAGNKIDVQKQIIVSSSRPNRRICEFANVVLFWNRVISFFSNFQIFCQKRDRAVAFSASYFSTPLAMFCGSASVVSQACFLRSPAVVCAAS